jgi:hypothetical protein
MLLRAARHCPPAKRSCKGGCQWKGLMFKSLQKLDWRRNLLAGSLVIRHAFSLSSLALHVQSRYHPINLSVCRRAFSNFTLKKMWGNALRSKKLEMLFPPGRLFRETYLQSKYMNPGNRKIVYRETLVGTPTQAVQTKMIIC